MKLLRSPPASACCQGSRTDRRNCRVRSCMLSRSRMTVSAARRMESLRWESQVPALLQAYDRALAPKPRVQEQEA